MADDRARDKRRVIDLESTRRNKRVNGRVQPVEASSAHKHEDEALDFVKPEVRKGPKLIVGPGWMGENK